MAGQPDRPELLSSLGASFFRRFEHLDDIADLDKAITVNQEAVLLAPYDMAILTSMDVLITSEPLSFISLGVWASLNESITARQEVIRLSPDGHPYMPGFLNNLGLSLLCRFERRDDIDEKITAQRQAVHLTPDSHPDKPGRLNNLGASFQRRFERLGDTADLNQAYRSRRCCGP